MKYNWEVIKTEYVTTDIGKRDCIAKYGLKYKTFCNKCSREKWDEIKENNRKERENIAKDKATELITDTQAQIYAEEYRIAQEFIKLIHKSIENGNYTDEYGALNTKKMQEAAKTLQMLLDIKSVCTKTDESKNSDISVVFPNEVNEWLV